MARRSSTAVAAPAREAATETEAKWMPSVIERWSPAALRPNARNPRKHPKTQIEHLAQRYMRVGFTRPVFAKRDGGQDSKAQSGELIAGHGRIEAAKLARLKTVPVIVCPDDWTPLQVREELLADNALGDGSKWDREMLGAELAELDALGADIKALGFAPMSQQTLGVGMQLQPIWQVLIECADEQSQRELLERFQTEGLKCRALIG